MDIILAAGGVIVVILSAEVLWRRKAISGEAGRKYVHVLAGSFIAFWPYFLSWHQIAWLALVGVVMAVVTNHTKLLHVGYDVKRRGRGEIYFPLAVGLAALVSQSPIIFTAAILHLSLADGLAALIGVRYGLKRQYKVRRYIKTVLGTMTFWAVSSLIVLMTVIFSSQLPHWPLWPLLICLPVAATLVENLAIAGLDNLAVPILVIVVLRLAGIS